MPPHAEEQNQADPYLGLFLLRVRAKNLAAPPEEPDLQPEVLPKEQPGVLLEVLPVAQQAQ